MCRRLNSHNHNRNHPLLLKSHQIIKAMMSYAKQVPPWISLCIPPDTYDCHLLVRGLPTYSTDTYDCHLLVRGLPTYSNASQIHRKLMKWPRTNIWLTVFCTKQVTYLVCKIGTHCKMQHGRIFISCIYTISQTWSCPMRDSPLTVLTCVNSCVCNSLSCALTVILCNQYVDMCSDKYAYPWTYHFLRI